MWLCKKKGSICTRFVLYHTAKATQESSLPEQIEGVEGVGRVVLGGQVALGGQAAMGSQVAMGGKAVLEGTAEMVLTAGHRCFHLD